MSPTLLVEISPTDPLAATAWQPISGVRSVSLKRGRSSELDQIQAGTATVVIDNRVGDWSPTNASSPWYPNLRPLNGLRISALADGGDTPFVMRSSTLRGGAVLRGGIRTLALFTGYLGSTGDQSYPWPDAVVTLQATDALKMLTATTNWGYFTPADLRAGGWITTALDRFNDITLTPWPAALRAIDTGVFLMQETRSVGYDTLAYILQVAETEGGQVFASKTGVLTFHDRAHLYPLDPVPWGDTASDSRYATIEIDPGSEDRIFNSIVIRVPSAADQTASDTTSIGHYFTRTKTLDSTSSIPSDMATRAAEILARYKDPHVRITSLQIRKGNWATILGKELYDQVTVKLNPPGPETLSQVSRIEGIDITTPEQGDWTVTWALSQV